MSATATSVSPASTANAGFTFSNHTVTYTVTAQDSTQKSYLVTVYPLLAAPGQILTVPADLSPGDHYRLVFVTSTTRTAASSDIALYNTHVSSAATAPTSLLKDLGTTWKAIVSTFGGVSAASNIGSFTVPVYNLNGLRVANSSADLWDSTIQNPINRNELGGSVSNTSVATGVNSGSGTNYNTEGALGDTGGGYIWMGSTLATDATWVARTRGPDKSYQSSFYGVSGDLIVPSPLSPDCDITSFTWNGYTGVIDEISNPKTIVLHVPVSYTHLTLPTNREV